MKRVEIRILKKRICNLIILGILLFGLIMAYKVYPTSKSEEIITSKVTYIDSTSQEELSFMVNTQDYDNGYYFELPNKINGLQVLKYYVDDNSSNNFDTENENNKNSNEDIEFLLPGSRYYFSEDEINSAQSFIKVVYNVKQSNNKDLYYKILETTLNNSLIKIEGYMPKDSNIDIKVADYNEIESKIKAEDSSLTLNIAYDIKILALGEQYEPNEFDENVKVTVSGIVDKQNPVGLKVIHIDDENKMEEIKSISIEEEDLLFSTESFSIFAIVSPSVNYTQVSGAWNGSVASSFSWGEGTQESPYLIANGDELAYLRTQVNNGQSYSGVYFKLIDNIDLNNNAWIPIGTATTSFGGVFDGQGYTISNAIITANGTNAQAYAYGVFGSIAGNESNSSIIKNVVFDNIKINVSFSSYEINTNLAYKLGIVSGAMYRYSKIENIIVRNSIITNDNSWITIASGYRPSVCIGGLVGEAAYSAENSLSQVNDGKYVINNCFSDVDISVVVFANETEAASRLVMGGIIGRISMHSTWPTSCLYTGSLGGGSNTFLTGPIFGGEITQGNDLAQDMNGLSDIWEGNLNATITSYYTNYIAKDTTFSSTITTGQTPDDTLYRKDAGPYWYNYVAGVNKGIYTTELSTTMLNMFNNNATNSDFAQWTYSNGTYDLNSGIELIVTETQDELYKFIISAESSLSEPQFQYSWYINGKLDNENTSNFAIFEPSFIASRKIQVLVTDGKYVSIAQFTLEGLTLGLIINENNGVLVPEFTGTGKDIAKFDKYDINWYEIDIVEGKTNSISTNKNFSQAKLYHEYQIELTNGYEGAETLTADYIYGEKNIIYVNNQGYIINGTSYVGNNNNNGTTPESAVNTLEKAYSLIPKNGTIESNIVVIMGNYNGTDYLDVRGGNASSYNSAASKFTKSALVTGKLRGKNYSANLNFSCKDNAYNGKYLFADTRFEYIIFNGKNGSTFFYLQGHDIIMGSGIQMTNYTSLDTSDFGHIKGLNSPKFSMFCGFHNYNYSKIPEESRQCTVLIKSGTFRKSCNWWS